MEALRTTSFDRYARYSYIYDLRRDWLPKRPLRILDVGDPYGTIEFLLPGDDTVSIDLFAAAPAGGPHARLIGSGLALPFPDGSFDLVASHDTLEHIPAELRTVFVDELLRVSSGPVLLVAPFADHRTAECEAFVNSYYVAHVGNSLDPLDEHVGFGLPDLGALVTTLRDRQLIHSVHSDGWLPHWLAFMLLKAHYVSLGAARLDRATDRAFNELLRARDTQGPHYRRAILIRPPDGRPVHPAPTPEPPTVIEEGVRYLSRLGRELMFALPHGQDPTEPHSAMRAWATSRTAGSGPDEELAESLLAVFDRVAEERQEQPTPLRTEPRPDVDVTVVVAEDLRTAAGVEAATRLLERIDAAWPNGGIEVLLWGRPDDLPAATGRRGIRWSDAVGDRTSRIARSTEQASADHVLLLGGLLDLPLDAIPVLLDGYEPGSGVVCVGYRERADEVAVDGLHDGLDGAPVSAGAVLLDRRALAHCGGWTRDTVGEPDGLDLCWRLQLAGFRTLVVGTAPRTSSRPRSRRTAAIDLVRTRFTLLEADRLAASFAGDLVSLLALEEGHEDRRRIIDLVEDLPALAQRRVEVQAHRACTDEDLFRRMGEPVLRLDEARAERQRSATMAALGSTTAHAVTSRVAVFGGADIQRAAWLADLTAGVRETILCLGSEAAVPPSDVPVVRRSDDRDTAALASSCGLVIVDLGVLSATPALLAVRTPLVIDLAGADPTDFDPHLLALRRGDSFVVESEAQREHWLGRLAAAGRPTPAERTADPALRRLIDVCAGPVGAGPTDAVRHILKGRDRGIELDSRLVVIDADPGEHGHDAVIELLDALAAVPGFGDLIRFYVLPAEGTIVGADLASAADRVGARIPAAPVDGESRRAILAEADLVVRPTGDRPAARLASPRHALSVAAMARPQLVTADDPAARLLRAAGAATVSDEVRSMVEDLRSLLDAPDRADVLGASAAGLAKRVHDAGLDVLRPRAERPWEWSGAHAGGAAVPSRPDGPPAPVVTLVTALPGVAGSDDHVDERVRSLQAELRRLRVSADEERRRADRLLGHPVVQAAIRARRWLLQHR